MFKCLSAERRLLDWQVKRYQSWLKYYRGLCNKHPMISSAGQKLPSESGKNSSVHAKLRHWISLQKRTALSDRKFLIRVQSGIASSTSTRSDPSKQAV